VPELVSDAVVDLQFDLQGTTIPKDHGYLLFQELSRLLPWLASEEQLGIHHIQGADTGHEELVLNRRVKLVVRAPATRVADLLTLTGQSVKLGKHVLTIGAAKSKQLSRHTPLFAHCVTTGNDDEVAFAADIMRLLDDMHIDSRFICGKRQTIKTAQGDVHGYSLMLHGLPVQHAIRVQQDGLGGNRKIGCGIFIPHKSLTALPTLD
jgi:CRISPR-associated protein Cas6